MRPDISEFSYGYALTEDLIRHSSSRRIAPRFPSLLEEGKPGGGYDMNLDFAGIPLFIQFKVSHLMKEYKRTIEHKRRLFDAAFYRLYLHPLRHSKQQPMLYDLEAKGNDVYYAAPGFYKVEDLNGAYASRQVAENSIFIRPSAIGLLPDDKDYHIAFQWPGDAFLVKTYQPIPTTGISELIQSLERKRQVQLERDLAKLSEQMESIVREHLEVADLGVLQQLSPARRVALLAHVFFDSEVLIVPPSAPSSG